MSFYQRNSFGSYDNLSQQQTQSKSTTFAALAKTSQYQQQQQLEPPITDILHAEVDYNMNEIDNIMVCKGRSIEIECSEFSQKHGLISKCLYIHSLLQTANLNESHLCADPLFYPQYSKAIITFNTNQDAEEFINSHNCKYRIVLKNTKPNEQQELTNNNNQKNVKFAIENSPITTPTSSTAMAAATLYDSVMNDTTNRSNRYSSSRNENINNSTTSVSTSNQQLYPTNKQTLLSTYNGGSNSVSDRPTSFSNYSLPINSEATVAFSVRDSGNETNTSYIKTSNLSEQNSLVKDLDDDNLNEIALKRNQLDGYETLTIRAKLRQRVGPNRKEHVQLQDIDLIMRSVVDVVQKEFMKRFPSATCTAPTITASASTNE